MMTEGVGETLSLADALGMFGSKSFLRAGARALLEVAHDLFRKPVPTFRDHALAGRLETLVARAPEFRPLHSLLDLAGGLGFLPFGAAFLLPLARGQHAGARRLLHFGLLLFRRGRLRGLRRGGLCQQRKRRR